MNGKTAQKTLKVLVTNHHRPEFNGNAIVLNKTNYNYDDLEDCVLLSNNGYSGLIQEKKQEAQKIAYNQNNIWKALDTSQIQIYIAR